MNYEVCSFLDIVLDSTHSAPRYWPQPEYGVDKGIPGEAEVRRAQQQATGHSQSSHS
ncbi:uncharacterized protein BDV14DRAFT_173456 [Aspergillus stella-maris]|uniref:uncharacterized protein n=1 Tax=Aspergillus stella-maris TaxID=1810926 RepID=UPI003CCD887C